VTSNSRECGKKKPYQKPNLRVYGDVQALTGAVNMGAKTDAQFMNKTG